jgi:hypothetical protein
MPRRIVLVLATVAGCVPPVAAESEVDIAAVLEPAAIHDHVKPVTKTTPSGFTPYSCEGIAPAEQIAWVDPELIRPWRELADTKDANGAWVAEVLAATHAKLPAEMTTEERVRLQHHLLRVASLLDTARRASRWRGWHRAHASVMSLIRSTAPTAAAIARLGDGARPDVTAILGPRSSIVERATKSCGSGASLHVDFNRGKLAFRPLRTATARALVAQLVAFDDEGKPHITPLVEGIEMRLGDHASSPACVVQAGDDGVLRPAAHAEIVEHPPFVQRNGTGVGCWRCHHDANTFNARDLSSTELARIDARRDAQVEVLAAQLWSFHRESLRRTAPLR